MEIICFEEINSTHIYLIETVKNEKITPPAAVYAKKQNGGIGSRGNRWRSLEGNLFLSFCVKKSDIDPALPIQSTSIYFSYILKELLNEKGSKIWLKWPNDFYIEDKKAGGVITAVLKDEIIVCSIGLNLKSAPQDFAKLDIDIDRENLLQSYFLKLKEDIFWKDIFRKYKVEFLQSTKYGFYDKSTQKRVSLEGALLQNDGSIILNNKRIYSLR